MSKLKKVLCVIALLSAVAMLASSCTAVKRYEKQVLNYLETEYEGKEFELLSYTKNKKTSSRYERNLISMPTPQTTFRTVTP